MASYRDFLPAVASGDGWQRPSDWLAMPTVTSAEQKFVGLHGVWEDGDNVVAFIFTGNYTVDWGDGNVENVSSGVKAEHQYVWGDIPAGTTTTQGYRQVLITVTPNGGNLLTCDFQQRYTGRTQPYRTGFLDVTLSMPNASGITFGGITVLYSNLQQFTIVTIGSLNSLAYLFHQTPALKSVPIFDTSGVLDMGNMFRESGIETLPLFDTSSVTNMNFMFMNTLSLQTLPLFDTSSVANFTSMFQASVIRSIPIFDTSSATNMGNMFRNAQNIQSIPALSTVGITTATGSDFTSLFAANCVSLTRCEMIFARAVGFASAGLGAPALVEIFNNLVDRTATTSATITITDNWGTPLLTAGELAIATSKNWIVTT